MFDGLGRELTEPPLWMRWLIVDRRQWAGLGWHLIDIVVFFGGLTTTFVLAGGCGKEEGA